MILAGHSMGSVIVSYLAAATQNNLINSVVLIEAVSPDRFQFEETEKFSKVLTSRLHQLTSPPEHHRFRNVGELAARLQKANPGLSAATAERLASRVSVTSGEDVHWAWDARLTIRSSVGPGIFPVMPLSEIIEQIAAPVTIVQAGREQDMESAETSGASQLTITGGHNLHLEQPDAIADIIRETTTAAKEPSYVATG